MNLLFTIRATAWQTEKKITFIHQNQLLDFKNNMNTVWRWGTRQKVLEVLEILGPRCFKTFQIKFRYLMFVFYSVLISLRARFSEVPSTHSPCWLLQKVFNTWGSQILHFPIGRAAQQPHYAPLKQSWGGKKRTGLLQCWLRNANSQSQRRPAALWNGAQQAAPTDGISFLVLTGHIISTLKRSPLEWAK